MTPIHYSAYFGYQIIKRHRVPVGDYVGLYLWINAVCRLINAYWRSKAVARLAYPPFCKCRRPRELEEVQSLPRLNSATSF